MKFLDDFGPKQYESIFGIDASSTHIGICVIKNDNIEALVHIKMTEKNIHDRMKDLRLKIQTLIQRYQPGYVLVESPIMVQNPLTTKNLSYIAGIIISTCIDLNIDVDEVSPMTWKTWIGYKRLTAKIKQDILANMGKTEGDKEIMRQKKLQVQVILSKRYPQWGNQIKNDNLADAMGIALYAQNSLRERKTIAAV